MCVIMLASKVRPTDEMIKRAWDQNHDGGGAAWRETDTQGRPEVVWKKGIQNVEDMLDLLHNIPPPYVAHFRIATVGGPKPTLTHPFLVDKSASTELEGRTKGMVLFHNGHWGDWNEKALDAAIGSNSKVPVGDWSDTRAVAWMVHIYGRGFMELLTQQKGVIWTPIDGQIFTGRDGWEQINQVWCSNDVFWNKRHGGYTNNHGTVCRSPGCQVRVFTGDLLCYPCKQKQQAKTIVLPGADVSEEHTSIPEKSDGVETLALSTLGGVRNPLVKFLTLSEAEELQERGGMSKSKMKDYRKLYKKIGQGGNQEERAIKKLTYISNIVAKDLLRGSVH